MEAIENDIKRFLSVSSGCGRGYGFRNGVGYGYGSGSGERNGTCIGNADGYGIGCGDGSGYGYDDGSGGSGGDGSGVKEFNGRKVYVIDGIPTLIYAVKGDAASGAVLQKDMTLYGCWIAKRGDFFAHGDTLRRAVEAAEAKWLENRPLEERMAEFVRTHPSLTGKYGDLFEWHHTLTGSCEFGRRRWCEEHGHEPTDSITLEEFFDKTKDDYGGDVIREVAEWYGVKL